jgi:ADP-ribosylglycohydrolase
MNDIYESKFRGCMVGLAIGDALGMPVEDLSYSEIKNRFGRVTEYLDPVEGLFNYGKLKAGMYTDDAEQAIVLAESLIENKGLNVNHFAKKLLSEYGKDVIEHPEKDRWIGGTFKKAVRNFISGLPLDKCGVKAKSCGSAMRVAPIGMAYWWTRADINLENAAKSSMVTHKGAEVTGAAQAVSLYVDMVITSASPEDISSLVADSIESRIIAKRVRKAYGLRNEKPEKVIRVLGDSGLARETVPTAIYSFNHAPNDFEEAVLTAVNMGGDTDSRAAITGAISGAFNGLDKIPSRWLEKIEGRDNLIRLGDSLRKTNRLIGNTLGRQII